MANVSNKKKDNLYEIISHVLNLGNRTGKSMLGYTLTQYEGVLSALAGAKQAKKNSRNNTNTNYDVAPPVEDEEYSFIGTANLNLVGKFENVGLIRVNKNNAIMSAEILPYMSCPIDYINPEGKRFKKWLKVSWHGENKHIQRGIGLNGGLPTFPPLNLTNTALEQLKDGCGAWHNPCVLGACVNIKMVKYFLDACYTLKAKFGWDENQIKTLAASGLLNVEVLILNNLDNGEYKTFHLKVTADEGNNILESKSRVYIPVPIMLTDLFSSTAFISVAVNAESSGSLVNRSLNNTNEMYLFPLRSSNYIFNKSELKDFTPQFLKSYSSTANPDMTLFTISSSSFWGEYSNWSAVRFYFSREAEKKLEAQLADLDDNKKKMLFEGITLRNTTTNAAIDNVGYIAEYGASFNAVLQDIAQQTGLTTNGVWNALVLTGVWERGIDKKSSGYDLRWTDWENTTRKDGAGFNMGPFSLTEASGGVHVAVNDLINRLPQYKSTLSDLLSRSNTHGKDLTGKSFQPKLTVLDGNTLRRIFNEHPDEYKAAYLSTVMSRGWGKNALKAYEYAKFNSALGFACALSHGIWKPSLVEDNYRRAKIADEPNQVTKVQLAGAAFFRTALQRKKYTDHTERAIIDAVINNKPAAQNWAGNFSPGGWYKRAKRLILNANGNLDINDISQFSKLFGYD